MFLPFFLLFCSYSHQLRRFLSRYSFAAAVPPTAPMSLPFGDQTAHFLLVTAPFPPSPKSRSHTPSSFCQVGLIGSCVTLLAFSFMWCNHRSDRMLHSAACLLAFTSSLRSPGISQASIAPLLIISSSAYPQLLRDLLRGRHRRQGQRVALSRHLLGAICGRVPHRLHCHVTNPP